MSKKIVKRSIIIALMLVISLCIFLCSNRILMLKRGDGIVPMNNLYLQEENSIDVLFLGSSHTGMNLDSDEMWNEYGISSYMLWGSVQPFWNSYYFLKEALKTQTPKVVVLDIYASCFEFEYSDDARQVTNTAGIKFGKNKIDAIKVSAPKERWVDLTLGFPLWHSRYNQLTEDDFKFFPWNKELINEKGTSFRYGIGKVTLEDVTSVTEEKQINAKEEEYLLKIIDLCEQKSIPLELIKTPTAERLSEQPYYNYVKKIADEKNITLTNFNLLDKETAINEQDYWTDNSHLNTNGARKITNYLAKYLRDKYQLVNRHNDSKYSSWDNNSVNIRNSYIKDITRKEDYFNELLRSEYSLFLIKNSGWENSDDYDNLLTAMNDAGIDTTAFAYSGGGDWFNEDISSSQFEDKFDGDMYSEFEFDGKVFSADFATGTGLCVDGKKVYTLNGKGIIFIVYDTKTHQCVDVVDFLLSNNFAMKRISIN